MKKNYLFKNLVFIMAAITAAVAISACTIKNSNADSSSTVSNTASVQAKISDTNLKDTPPQKPEGEPPSGMPGGGGPGGGASKPESYTAVNTYTADADISNETIQSTGKDENAVHISNGANVVIKDSSISRISSESKGGDSSSFYGVGAAILSSEGNVYISKSNITTDSAGAAGAFAYDKGAVYISDTTIKTSKDTAGGLHVAGGGKLYAWNVNAETSGESSAAIRSDRGGGTMVIDGGSYTSNGSGSPAVYSTADISINNAKLTANGSEAVCIEGLNSLRLYNSELSGNMSDLEQNGLTWNVILYQSMSGDSEVGNSTFEMDGGSLTAKNGGMFYSTNTESTFILKNVAINYADENDFFLRVTGNSNQRGWGQSGANGADTHFTAINQEMIGDIIWDSISQLDFYMTEGSTLTGSAIDDESDAGSGGSGYANFYISSDSTWIVTGSSTLTDLYNAGAIKDASGNTVTIKDSSGKIYVNGTSPYTVTVANYSTEADLSGASKISQWSDYSVEKPSQL